MLTAEFETGVAQPALMDLIDRSITTLCQISWDQPSDTHWCRLWRSGNYHHNDRISYAVDFLGFAAWSGLGQYVEYILGSQSEQRTADTVDYLLRCSVHGLKIIRSDSFAEFKLIQTLLKRGADPNMENLDRTPWGLFLQELYEQYSN